MKFIHEEITIDTSENVELINITHIVNEIVQKNNMVEGLVNISTKHTTTSIIINEDEEGLKNDIINLYGDIINLKHYFHDKIDNNARSHLKSILSSSNQTLPVICGELSLGIWQNIFFAEFDGPRKSRKIIITLIK